MNVRYHANANSITFPLHVYEKHIIVYVLRCFDSLTYIEMTYLEIIYVTNLNVPLSAKCSRLYQNHN